MREKFFVSCSIGKGLFREKEDDNGIVWQLWDRRARKWVYHPDAVAYCTGLKEARCVSEEEAIAIMKKEREDKILKTRS